MINDTAEWHLLLAACSVAPDAPAVIARLCPVVDWDAFLALVDRHQVYTQVYQALTTHAPPEYWPASARAQLAHWSAGSRTQSMHLLGELVRLTKLLAQHEIQLLSLKGSVLSQVLWQNWGVRQSGDLDLLVTPAQLAATEQLLLADGYRRKVPDFTLTPRQRRAFLRYGPHFSFQHPTRGTHLDLHWHIKYAHWLPPAHERQMLDNAEEIVIAGCALRTLNAGDNLLYLCLHGAAHGWERLKWLCDVARLVSVAQTEIDWRNWGESVKAAGLVRAVAQSLWLAHLLLDAKLPSEIAWLNESDAVRPALLAYGQEQLASPLDDGSAASSFVTSWHTARYVLRLKDGWRFKWGYCNKLWLAPALWRDFPLPDKLFPLYYLLRPLLRLGQTSKAEKHIKTKKDVPKIVA